MPVNPVRVCKTQTVDHRLRLIQLMAGDSDDEDPVLRGESRVAKPIVLKGDLAEVMQAAVVFDRELCFRPVDVELVRADGSARRAPGGP